MAAIQSTTTALSSITRTSRDRDRREDNEMEDTEPSNSEFTRQDLINIVRNSGISVSNSYNDFKKTSNETREAISEPTSPRKLLKRISSSSFRKDSSTSTGSDTTTLTSEEGTIDSDEPPGCHNNTSTLKRNENGLLSNTDNQDLPDILNEGDFRLRSGSLFYHESFRPTDKSVVSKPVTYIPSNRSESNFFVRSSNKKKKGFFSKIRNSFRSSSNKPHHQPIGRTVSDKTPPTSKRWIDHEDELDVVGRPSYFRHIGHIIGTGPGNIQTIQLNRPPHGKFGVYIVQGIDSKTPDKSSVFVSRFYQENMSMFYATLLRPGDEIVAINGSMVRDVHIDKVTDILEGCDTVRLTILPNINS
jgi:hypothetical protein